MNTLTLKHKNIKKAHFNINPDNGFEDSDINDAIRKYLENNGIEYIPKNASPPALSANYTDIDGAKIWAW